MRANEHLANIIGEDHPKYHIIKNMSKRYPLTCRVKQFSDNHLDMIHIATGCHINLAKDTLSDEMSNNNLLLGKKMFATVMQWGDEWALMGGMVSLPDKGNEDIIDKEKHIFDPMEPKMKALELHEECFKELTGGSVLTYFRTPEECDEFFERFWVHLFKKTNPDKTYPGHPKKNVETKKMMNYVVLFFNHQKGIEIYPDFSYCIRDPQNPYYKNGETDCIEALSTEKSISPKYIKYIGENDLIDLDQDKYMDDQTIKENLDFLLRYFKLQSYYVEPSITIVNTS